MTDSSHPGAKELDAVIGNPSELLHQAVDTFSDPVFVKDRQHRWIAANRAFVALFHLPAEQVIGKSDPDFFPPEQVQVFWRGDDELFESARPSENEERLTDGNGTVRTIWTRKYPIFDSSGQVIALSGIITDVTKIRGTLEKAVRLEAEVEEKQRIINAQEQLLSRLAVPVIQIWRGILLVPLIGEITSRRALQVLESLLSAISTQRAQYVLLDITGMTVVDAKVVSYLVQAVQSTRLLGCQSIMVGIASDVAIEFVRLGADFSSLITMSTLQQGLEWAIARLSSKAPQGATKDVLRKR